tara:strand:- start:2037 stop:2825 length:789 start_codon:yes stop_codon:yes gene_type:complete
MISIVTAYYNRKPQFLTTLKSIAKSSFKDFEIVVVDDGSSEEHVISEEDLKPYGIDIKVLRIKPEQKTHVNPCVAFNVGFNNASGETIIMQNPECFHMGDVLSYVNENLKDNQYTSFSCWSADPDISKKIQDMAGEGVESIKGMIGDFGTKDTSKTSWGAWYNHPQYRPKLYHFCSAIKKKDLIDIGGFDPVYANACGYDDDSIVWSINKKGMETKVVDDPFVIHQYHPALCDSSKGTNHSLFINYTLKKKSYKVSNTEVYE